MAIPKRVVSQGQLPPPPPMELWSDGLMVADKEAANIALENYLAEEERKKQEAAKRRVVYVPTTVIRITDQVEGYTKSQMYNCYNFVEPYILKGYGNAINHPAPSKTPKVGSIMVSKEGNRGHYSKVLAVFENDFVIGEFNFIRGFYTERVISKNSPIIKGFYN